MKSSIIILIISLLCVGCSDRHSRLLDRAEQLTFTDPDSACALLDSMPAPASGELRARHALLTTGAQYYAARCPETDSIIRIAVDYYDTRTDSPRRMLSYYYQGLVLIKARDYGNAVVSLLNAEHTARILNDHKYLGLIYRAIADSFDDVNDNSSALDYYKKSYEEFCIADSTIYRDYALCDLSRGYCNAFKYDEGLVVADSTILRAEASGDIQLKVDGLRCKGKAYKGLNKFEQAKKTFLDLKEIGNEYMRDADWLDLGLLYLSTNDLDNAIIILDSVKKYYPGDASLNYAICKKQGMYEDAIPLLESELKFQNDAFYNFVTRDFAQIISKLYDKSLSNTRDDIRYQRNTSILIAIIGALFIIIVCVYIFRIKHLREIERNNILTIQSLQNNLKDKIKEIDLIKLQSESKIKDEHLKTNIRIAEMQDLISEQFKTVDHLCTSYFEFRGHKNEKQAIYNKVLDLINDWGENESFISRLALIADKSKNRVFTRFKQAYPD